MIRVFKLDLVASCLTLATLSAYNGLVKMHALADYNEIYLVMVYM